MKTNVLTSLLTLLCLLAGCGGDSAERSPYSEVNTLDGIWIEAVPETVTPTGLTVAFCNATERNDIVHGYGFCVEVWKGEQWYSVKDLIWEGPAIALEVPTASQIKEGVPNEQEYQWKTYCGALEPGTYRLVISVGSMNDAPNPVNYFLTAPFEIKEGGS